MHRLYVNVFKVTKALLGERVVVKEVTFDFELAAWWAITDILSDVYVVSIGDRLYGGKVKN